MPPGTSFIGSKAVWHKCSCCQQMMCPDNLLKKNPTILIWDNIDFTEETLSGHGTSHHTNGILVQRVIHEVEGAPRRTIQKKKSSLIPLAGNRHGIIPSKTEEGPQNDHNWQPSL